MASRWVGRALLLVIVCLPLGAAGEPASETRLGVRDQGVFSDLDGRVQLRLPRGLDRREVYAVVDRARGQLVLYRWDQPLKVYPLAGSERLELGGSELSLRPGDASELRPLLAAERLVVFDAALELPPGDADGDGIPDPLDVLIGAKKTVLNADRYDGRYERITYPGGDVPREIGVCTDVIIRALRNAGYDLQQLLHEDLMKARGAYRIAQPNTDIDHRRVKNMLPYFQRHMIGRSAGLRDAADPLRPGDVVFMDTFADRPGCEHVGIVGDNYGPEGLPLIINNWTDGTVTREMNLLTFVPVTQRFRLPAKLQDRGPISALRTQLVTVVTDTWQATRGTLRRYEREPGKRWRAVGTALPVVLGHAGYGWGDGLHGQGAPAGRTGPSKREGDGRSPAGAFEFGTLYGYAPQSTANPALPYDQATAATHCVDDPSATLYNHISAAPDKPWRSAERMLRDDDIYEQALVIAHNTTPITKGHGSCIFLHVWTNKDTPVTGCTALSKANLGSVLRWLKRNAAVLVALPASEYSGLTAAWGLP